MINKNTLRKNGQVKERSWTWPKKIVERIGHEIKENIELAEHQTGIDNTKSKFSKIKKALR